MQERVAVASCVFVRAFFAQFFFSSFSPRTQLRVAKFRSSANFVKSFRLPATRISKKKKIEFKREFREWNFGKFCVRVFTIGAANFERKQNSERKAAEIISIDSKVRNRFPFWGGGGCERVIVVRPFFFFLFL